MVAARGVRTGGHPVPIGPIVALGAPIGNRELRRAPRLEAGRRALSSGAARPVRDPGTSKGCGADQDCGDSMSDYRPLGLRGLPAMSARAAFELPEFLTGTVEHHRRPV